MKYVSVFHLHIDDFHLVFSTENLSPIGTLTAGLGVKVRAIEYSNERGGRGGGRYGSRRIGRNGIDDLAICNDGHQLSFDARKKTVLALNPETRLKSLD